MLEGDDVLRSADPRARPTVLHSPLDPTRARPEPWFVGSGRGLMILIVSLCAVLLVARGVTMIWMAEAAWDWFRRPTSTSEPASGKPIASPSSADLVAPPPAPANVADRPRAIANDDIGQFFSADSYPREALRRGEQGRVVARLAVGVDGRSTGCTVVISSRSPSLDRSTCAIGVMNARFVPAEDGQGRPVPSRYDLKVRWALDD